MNTTKIVTIGGGTGAPVVIKSLIQAGFGNISAISTATDSGGRSGRVRTDERDRIISIGDLIKNLLALITPSQRELPQVKAFAEMFDFTDGRYRNLGYQIYYALLEKYHNNFLKVQRHFECLLNIRFAGTAIPVTLEPTHISFSTATGAIYHGEHELDRQSMSANTIQDIWLDHKVTATPEAIKAIKGASHIIFCPGSIYSSVLANLLPTGIITALKSSPATKILISNLVSNRNQTHQFSPLDYYHLFKKYTHLDPPFDIFISPDINQVEFEKKYPQVAANYATEHSHFLGWDNNQLAILSKYKIKSVTCNCIAVTPELSRIRHCPDALSQVFKQLIRTVK
jgi:uncharacterized cofD-like protein